MNADQKLRRAPRPRGPRQSGGSADVFHAYGALFGAPRQPPNPCRRHRAASRRRRSLRSSPHCLPRPHGPTTGTGKPPGFRMPVAPDPVDVAIGGRIKFRRQEVDLTQLALARNIGISVQQMQKYESGQNRIAASRLIDVAAALSTSAADLIGEGLDAGADSGLLRVAGAVDLLKAYELIPDPAHRKSILAMVRSLAANPRDGDGR